MSQSMRDSARSAAFDRPDADPVFGRSMFICSKPLQAINCLSICRYYELERPQIFVVEKTFASCARFVELLAGSRTSYPCEFRIFPSHAAAADALPEYEYDSLFVEDDRASMYYLAAPHKRRFLSVFEEGLGTYIQFVHFRLNTLKGLKWRTISAFGECASSFGEGKRTDFVLVSEPQLYSRVRRKHRARVLPFPGVLDELTRTQDVWFGELERAEPSLRAKAGNAALILGTWGTSRMKLRELVGDAHDKVFFKAHPHDSSGTGEPWQEIGVPHVPAESLVTYLARVSTSLTVYHFQSSTALYCRNLPNIRFVDLRAPDRAAERVLRTAWQQAGTLAP